MILILGAQGAGKKEYAMSLGYAEADMADGVLDEKPVLNNLQRLCFADPEHAGDMLEALCRKQAVICNEVGSGIIPLDRKEREGREATGRLCVQLAQRAEKVIRVVAGIGTVIKG